MKAFMRPFKKGDIILWYGAVADIRKGWALCDGNNGTPDLRGVSVIGAGGSFNVGATGGAVSHTHTFTGDGHRHDLVAGAELNINAPLAVKLPSSNAVGTTDGETTRSPYHALCFIMKL